MQSPSHIHFSEYRAAADLHTNMFKDSDETKSRAFQGLLGEGD